MRERWSLLNLTVAFHLVVLAAPCALGAELSLEAVAGPEWAVEEVGFGAEPVAAPELPEDLQVSFREAAGEVLSLEEVTRMAVARSLDIDILRLDQEIKAEAVPIERSKYDTELTVDGEYEIDETQPASSIAGTRTVTGAVNTTLEKLLPSGTEVTLEHSASRESSNSAFATLSRQYEGALELSVIQPVLENRFGLIDRGKVQLVELDVRRFDYETADRIEAEVFRARTAYWDLVFAHRDLAAKRRALQQAQEFFTTTREKLLLGLVEPQDVYAAEANVRLRVIDALEAQMVLANRQEALQVLLDLPHGMVVVPSTVPVFEDAPVSVEESVSRALQDRRDYRQLVLDLETAEVTQRMKRSALLPELDLEASYRSHGLDRDLFDAQGELGGFNHPTLFAGFTFNVPLENREAKAEYRQAKLTRQRVTVAMRRLARQIERDVREAVRQLALAAARVKQVREAEALQRSKLIEESRAFQYGRSDSRTIIDFQEDLIEAETQAQDALVGHRKAADALLRTEHRLLETSGVTAP